MLNIDTITTAGQRIERAYADLVRAIDGATEAVEATNDARHELEAEEARIVTETDPKDLGSNEATRKAAVAQLTIIQRQALAAAETEERRAKAFLEQVKAEVSAAKRSLEVLDLAARVLSAAPVALPAVPAVRPAPAVPSLAVTLDRPVGSLVLITGLSGDEKQVGSIAEHDHENGMYWVTYGQGSKCRIPPCYLLDLPKDWTPAAPAEPEAAPVAQVEDDAKVTQGQVAALLELADRAFPTLAGFTKWLWNTHQLSKPQLELQRGGVYNTIVAQLEEIAAERAAKPAAKGKAKAKPAVVSAIEPVEPEETTEPATEPAPEAPAVEGPEPGSPEFFAARGYDQYGAPVKPAEPAPVEAPAPAEVADDFDDFAA